MKQAALALILLAARVPARAQYSEEADLEGIAVSGETAESVILPWPMYSYRLARMMIAEYGQPSEVRETRLVWVDNAPWKRTVVYRDPPSDKPFRRDKGRLEQTASFPTPAGRLADLSRFDDGIKADAASSLLTASSDSESGNFLALNLAAEVIKGTRTPQDAADARRKLERLQSSGKASPYLDGLIFAPGTPATSPETPQ